MLLTISTDHTPATDLGFLLHKNPARPQSFDLTFGKAHVFYPEASPERCTVALLLDIDPIALIRGRRGGSDSAPLAQYVNDRPYVASSFLSVAIAEVFGSALNGRCRERPELVDIALPLQASLQVVPCASGEPFLRGLFEPLGYTVTTERHILDERFPEWGDSPYYTVHLTGRVRLTDLLTHLYVLVPTMDAEKHYAVGDDEVEKLLRRGGDWLSAHPERDVIVRRYLKHRRSLVDAALERLTQEEVPEGDESEIRHDREEEEVVERPISLHQQRLESVKGVLHESGAKRVLDLGCGEGRLIRMLLAEKQFAEIVGVDVSHRALEIAQDRLRLDRLPTMQRDRIRLMQGALTYRDERLTGYDAAAVVEVIEHLDQPRLAAFGRVVFEFARPRTVVVTTPNVEYNVRFETLPAGKFRHRDHRFEWTRAEFQTWAGEIGARFGYTTRFLPVGPEDPEVGAPSQMAVFERVEASVEEVTGEHA